MRHKIHPLAEIFPMMEDSELQELAADIKKVGLRAPITLFKGEILDGRNRLRACEIAGVEPKFLERSIDDPEAFVLSANLHRRHMTTGQRAMVAAKLENMAHGRSEKKEVNLPLTPQITRAEAAEKLSVSTASVKSASKVLDESPKLAKKVSDGKITLNKAVEKLKEKKVELLPKGAKSPDVLDNVGRVIPLVLVDSWNRRGEIDDLMTHVSKVRSKIKSAMDSGDPFYGGFDCGKYYSQLSQLYTSLKHVIPYTVCTTCQGLQRAVCTFCHGKGFICESDWDICVPVEVKEMISRTVEK